MYTVCRGGSVSEQASFASPAPAAPNGSNRQDLCAADETHHLRLLGLSGRLGLGLSGRRGLGFSGRRGLVALLCRDDDLAGLLHSTAVVRPSVTASTLAAVLRLGRDKIRCVRDRTIFSMMLVTSETFSMPSVAAPSMVMSNFSSSAIMISTYTMAFICSSSPAE